MVDVTYPFLDFILKLHTNKIYPPQLEQSYSNGFSIVFSISESVDRHIIIKYSFAPHLLYTTYRKSLLSHLFIGIRDWVLKILLEDNYLMLNTTCNFRLTNYVIHYVLR